jgi:checkpoint serine/threonine-protein kinase
MLFGKYIDTVADKGAGIGATAKKSWRIREALKRYWQVEIWGKCFDLLLNPGNFVEGEEAVKLPVLKGMKGVREMMEGWLEGNCERGVGLQASLRKLEASIAAKRR